MLTLSFFRSPILPIVRAIGVAPALPMRIIVSIQLVRMVVVVEVIVGLGEEAANPTEQLCSLQII